ncbi:MAG: HU family DNA-binding protein [Mariprofundaceae bacterium]|nr:HU family DNA-binding protein [Mariprofundaceae bacterium]
MNKADLINHVAAAADLTKGSAGDAVEAVLGGITGTLSNGDSVSLVGFGTFSVVERSARTARNPRTGEAINVPASKAPKFKAGKALKDAVKK